jgi:hypothetical protein
LHERLQGAGLEQPSIGIAMDGLVFGHSVNLCRLHFHRLEDRGRLSIRGFDP